MNFYPRELADAMNASRNAWLAYDAAIENGKSMLEWHPLLMASTKADVVVTDLYARWQKLGGTSDIESIIDAEIAKAYTLPAKPVLSVMEPTSGQLSQLATGSYNLEEGSTRRWWDDIKEINPDESI